MRRFFFFLVLLAASFPSQAAPNVLLITVDTLRADHLSCYGYAWRTSPNIDRLASEGARFERAYTVIPLTGPAHFSLLTSRYPQEHGARTNGLAVPEQAKLPFLPQVLQRHGYRTAAFVSAWPLTNRLTHLNRWFHYYDENLTRRYQLFNSSRYAEDVTPVAVRWLEQNSTKRFFLWVHYFDPHSPYELRPEFASLAETGASASRDRERSDRVLRYDSEIAYTDRYIRDLMDAVDRLKLRSSTLVVLTADHGESLGEHDYVGHGRQLFENIIRVPLLARLPGVVKAGKVINEQVSLLDVMPTILELTLGRGGTEARLYRLLAGRSLAPALSGDASPGARSIRYVTFAGKKGFFPQWLSWLWMPKAELPLRVGRTDGSRKLIWSPEESSLAVYDVKRDQQEAKPMFVKAESSEYQAETSLLARWFASTDLASGEAVLSKRDVEVLRSLGYIQ